MSVPYAILPLTEDQIPACCSLEARAFNLLRRAWGQAPQPERRQDCLRHQIQLFPEGAFGALAEGRVVGFCISHAWGTLGWIGPIAVEPEWQGRGIGRELTQAVLRGLEANQSLTIALETWPHHAVNVQFYLTSGFEPGPLVFILEKRISGDRASFTGSRVNDPSDLGSGLRRMAALSGEIQHGLDYTAPIRTTLECGLGEVLMWGTGPQAEAGAVVHLAPQHQGPPPEWADVQLLVARPGSAGALGEWLGQLEGVALGAGRKRLRIAVPGNQPRVLETLTRRDGYRVVKLRLRMYYRRLAQPPETVDLISYGI